MATNKSEHLQLHLWEPEDSVLRTEFNENWEKIDGAAERLQSGLEEVKTTFPVQHFATGSYKGNSGTQTISLGFAPKVVFVHNSYGSANDAYRSGLALAGLPFNGNASVANLLTITEGGFAVTHSTNWSLNYNLYTYHYIAIA